MKRALASLLLLLSIGGSSLPAEAGVIERLAPEGSDAFKGKIVDTFTRKPLAGVMVIASWHDATVVNENKGVKGVLFAKLSYSCYQLVNVETAVSGPDGSYEIPAWSGKHGKCDHMLVEQPYLIFYKPGYAVYEIPLVPGTHPWDVGPNFSKAPPPDVGPLTLTPLGLHRWMPGDKHVANLQAYAFALHTSLYAEGGACFWDAAGPALRLLFQEERRLSNYASGLDVYNSRDLGPISRCTDQATVEAFRRQSQTGIQPEVPILPYVREGQWAEASAPPQALRSFLEEEKAPDHADDAQSVVYHVSVDPDNPYYLAVLSIGSRYGDVGVPGSPQPPAANTLERKGVYGLTCPAYDDIHPVSTEYEYQAGGTMENPLVAPPPAPSKSVARVCRWTVALSDSTERDFLGHSGMNWDYYTVVNRTWILTERSVVRADGETAPEILEIHGPSLIFGTTLTPAGPNRWRLPPPGQPFTIAITAQGPQ